MKAPACVCVCVCLCVCVCVLDSGRGEKNRDTGCQFSYHHSPLVFYCGTTSLQALCIKRSTHSSRQSSRRSRRSRRQAAGEKGGEEVEGPGGMKG